MSRRNSGDSDGRRHDEADEETGWLDDLRSAKQSGDRLGGTDFTGGGTDRYAKLGALSGDGKDSGRPAAPPPAADRRRPAEPAPAADRRRRGDAPPATDRRMPADPPPATDRRRAAQPQEQLPRRTPGTGQLPGAGREAGGRRAAAEPEPISPAAGRRAPAEPDAVSLIGRRSRAAEEPDPKSLIGRRSRTEPDAASLIGRRARPEDPISPAAERLDVPTSPAGRRPADEGTGRRGRPDNPLSPAARREAEEALGRRGRPEQPGGRHAPPSEPISPAARRVVEETLGRRSADEPAGRHAPSEPDAPSLIGRRARGKPEAPEPPSRAGGGRHGRADAEPFPMPEALRPPAGPSRHAEPDRARPIIPPGKQEPRRRPLFGERPRPVSPSGPGSPIVPGSPGMPPGSPASPVSPAVRPAVSPPEQGRRPRSPFGPPEPSKVAPGSAIPANGMPPNSAVPTPAMAAAGGITPPTLGERQRGARFAAAGEAIKGARSEVRRQLREQQRLRMWTLITLVVALVGALPFYFALRAAARDPVLTSLDALTVPSWAVAVKDDNITGSRWCLMDCRYRERTVQSQRSIQETAKVYQDALLTAGWAQITGIPGCPPDVAEGEHGSCWRRDEFTLDLWIREPPACADDLLRKRPKIEQTATPESPEPEPSVAPSATVDECDGSTVTIKVFNAIADERLKWTPESTTGPDLGDLTDEDLSTFAPTPTPEAS